MSTTPVDTEAIAAAGQLSRALGEAIAGLAAAGQLAYSKILLDELVRVSKSLTWLLREDRHEFEYIDGKLKRKEAAAPTA